MTFVPAEAGAVESVFRSRRDGNRVFYATSLKQARGWARFTSIPYNPTDYDFRKYSVLAVFYKGRTLDGFEPKFDAVQESAAGELSATITLECSKPGVCAAPPSDPDLWGMYVLTKIDRRSLVTWPKTLHVTTAFH